MALRAAMLVSTGVIFLGVEGDGTQLGQRGVVRAMLLNLAAYAIWAVFGVGFGALTRGQLTATVAATVLYLVGAAAARGGVRPAVRTSSRAGSSPPRSSSRP